MYSNPFGSAKFGGGGGGQNTGGGGDLSGQILTTVKQDMESVEKSGQWVFSCYSPAKVSPESRVTMTKCDDVTCVRTAPVSPAWTTSAPRS